MFSNFYGLSGLGDQAFVVIGIAQAVIVLAFTLALLKTFSYGAVLAMHTVSTLSSWRQYLEPAHWMANAGRSCWHLGEELARADV